MIPHAAIYDGALAQVMAVRLSESSDCSKAERRKFYKNKGCCVAAIISMHGSADGDALPDDDNEDEEEEEEERLETQQFPPKKRALNVD